MKLWILLLFLTVWITRGQEYDKEEDEEYVSNVIPSLLDPEYYGFSEEGSLEEAVMEQVNEIILTETARRAMEEEADDLIDKTDDLFDENDDLFDETDDLFDENDDLFDETDALFDETDALFDETDLIDETDDPFNETDNPFYEIDDLFEEKDDFFDGTDDLSDERDDIFEKDFSHSAEMDRLMDHFTDRDSSEDSDSDEESNEDSREEDSKSDPSEEDGRWNAGSKLRNIFKSVERFRQIRQRMFSHWDPSRGHRGHHRGHPRGHGGHHKGHEHHHRGHGGHHRGHEGHHRGHEGHHKGHEHHHRGHEGHNHTGLHRYHMMLESLRNLTLDNPVSEQLHLLRLYGGWNYHVPSLWQRSRESEEDFEPEMGSDEESTEEHDSSSEEEDTSKGFVGYRRGRKGQHRRRSRGQKHGSEEASRSSDDSSDEKSPSRNNRGHQKGHHRGHSRQHQQQRVHYRGHPEGHPDRKGAGRGHHVCRLLTSVFSMPLMTRARTAGSAGTVRVLSQASERVQQCCSISSSAEKEDNSLMECLMDAHGKTLREILCQEDAKKPSPCCSEDSEETTSCLVQSLLNSTRQRQYVQGDNLERRVEYICDKAQENRPRSSHWLYRSMPQRNRWVRAISKRREQTSVCCQSPNRTDIMDCLVGLQYKQFEQACEGAKPGKASRGWLLDQCCLASDKDRDDCFAKFIHPHGLSHQLESIKMESAKKELSEVFRCLVTRRHSDCLENIQGQEPGLVVIRDTVDKEELASDAREQLRPWRYHRRPRLFHPTPQVDDDDQPKTWREVVSRMATRMFPTKVSKNASNGTRMDVSSDLSSSSSSASSSSSSSSSSFDDDAEVPYEIEMRETSSDVDLPSMILILPTGEEITANVNDPDKEKTTLGGDEDGGEREERWRRWRVQPKPRTPNARPNRRGRRRGAMWRELTDRMTPRKP